MRIEKKEARPRRMSDMRPKPLLFLLGGTVCCMSDDAAGIGTCWKSAYADWLGIALERRLRKLIVPLTPPLDKPAVMNAARRTREPA